MKYVRKIRKNKDKLQVVQGATSAETDPDTYKFPEIDEFFIYTPQSNTGGAGNSYGGGGVKGVKMTVDSVTYCTFWFS